MPLDPVTPAETLEQAAAIIDYDAFRRRAGAGVRARRPARSASASGCTSSRQHRDGPAWHRGRERPRRARADRSRAPSAPARTARASRRRSPRSSPSISASTSTTSPSSGRHRRDAVRARHRRQPHRGHRRQRGRDACAAAARRRCSTIAAHLARGRARGPRDRRRRGRRCAARRRATSPLAEVAHIAYLAGRALPPGMEPGSRRRPVHRRRPFTWSNAVPHVHRRGRPRTPAWSRSCATSSARTAA